MKIEKEKMKGWRNGARHGGVQTDRAGVRQPLIKFVRIFNESTVFEIRAISLIILLKLCLKYENKHIRRMYKMYLGLSQASLTHLTAHSSPFQTAPPFRQQNRRFRKRCSAKNFG